MGLLEGKVAITKKTEDGLWTAHEIAAQMREGEILLPK